MEKSEHTVLMACINRTGNLAFTISRTQRFNPKGKVIEEWSTEISPSTIADETYKATVSKHKFRMDLITSLGKRPICKIERKKLPDGKHEDVLIMTDPEFNGFARGVPFIIVKKPMKASA